MDVIKSKARGPAVYESVLYGFYIFYLSIAQAMNRLIVVFVSREEWSTAAAVIEPDYKAANLIPISLVKSSNFLVQVIPQSVKIFQFHVYRKIQCSVSSFKPRYPTAKPKNYQHNVTVGGGFISIRERFRNGPELTNRQSQLSVCLHLLPSISGHVKFIWEATVLCISCACF